MKTTFLLPVTLFLLFTASSFATRVERFFRNSDGEPMANITIRATRTLPAPLTVETVTSIEGKFTFDLADGDWFIEADPADLLNRGYFCAPGIGIGINDGIAFIPGDISIIFVAVPLRPDLTLLTQNEQIIIELDFDWMPGLQPTLLRGYRVERSIDLQNWESLGTVLLANPPIYVVDPAGQEQDEEVYYRTIASVPLLRISNQ